MDGYELEISESIGPMSGAQFCKKEKLSAACILLRSWLWITLSVGLGSNLSAKDSEIILFLSKFWQLKKEDTSNNANVTCYSICQNLFELIFLDS